MIWYPNIQESAKIPSISFLDVGISWHASFDTGGFGKPFDTRCVYWRIPPSGDDEIFDTTSISTTCRTWPKEEAIRICDLIESEQNLPKALMICTLAWGLVANDYRNSGILSKSRSSFASNYTTIKIWDEVLGWERIFDGSASEAFIKPFRTLKWLPPYSTHNNIEEQANLLFVFWCAEIGECISGLGSIAKHCK
jgi:hypothetical protein